MMQSETGAENELDDAIELVHCRPSALFAGIRTETDTRPTAKMCFQDEEEEISPLQHEEAPVFRSSRSCPSLDSVHVSSCPAVVCQSRTSESLVTTTIGSDAAKLLVRMPRQRTRTVRLDSSSRQASSKYDFFLSHRQANAQDAVMALRLCLAEVLPAASFWVDTEQNPTEYGMHHGVKTCENFLVYLTKGVTASKWCQQELRWALEYNKNIILVGETDERHAKPDIDELIRAAPTDLRPIFSSHAIIPWYRDAEFREVSVQKILRLANCKALGPFVDGEEALRYGPGVDGEPVCDKYFVKFMALCGIALPGASKRVRRWGSACQMMLFVCSLACASNFFIVEGPAFLDQFTSFHLVVGHFIFILFLHTSISILASPLVADILQNRIDCKQEAERLRRHTSIAARVAILLVTIMTVVSLLCYLPGFLSPYYLRPDGVYGIFGVIFAVGSTAMYITLCFSFWGAPCASVLLMYVVQELAFMGLLGCFDSLHPRVTDQGIKAIVAEGKGLDVQEEDVYRFQAHYIHAHDRYEKLHRSAALPFHVFCVMQMLFLSCFSVTSIMTGMDLDPQDERAVEQLREFWHLRIRLMVFLLLGIVGGVFAYVLALLPWFCNHYSRCMKRITTKLLFTRPDLRTHLTFFTDRFDLDYSVGFIHAKPYLLPMYSVVVILNTAGCGLEAMRRLRGL